MQDKQRDRARAACTEALNRWKRIIPVNIAKAVHHCVQGRTEKLCANAGNPQSIWSKIVKHMGLPNQKVDRLWAAAAFHSDVKEIKVPLTTL